MSCWWTMPPLFSCTKFWFCPARVSVWSSLLSFFFTAVYFRFACVVVRRGWACAVVSIQVSSLSFCSFPFSFIFFFCHLFLSTFSLSHFFYVSCGLRGRCVNKIHWCHVKERARRHRQMKIQGQQQEEEAEEKRWCMSALFLQEMSALLISHSAPCESGPRREKKRRMGREKEKTEMKTLSVLILFSLYVLFFPGPTFSAFIFWFQPMFGFVNKRRDSRTDITYLQAEQQTAIMQQKKTLLGTAESVILFCSGFAIKQFSCL